MKRENVEIKGDLLKKLQQVELEMLIEVDRICRKHNIKYTIAFGTLLGAVRQGGYIPWDDDCDVIFRRSEYEKFFNACKKDLDTSRFFLQEHRTDPNYLFGYSKIRREGTVFERTGQEHIKQHGGVFMDLMIYDNIPDGMIARTINMFELYVIRSILNSKIFKKTAYKSWSRAIYSILDLIPKDRVFHLLNKIQTKYNSKDTKLSRIYTYIEDSSDFWGHKSELFEDVDEIEFEGHKFLATKNYKEVLTIFYGPNYMELPPEKSRHPHINATKISFGNLFDDNPL